MVFRRSKLVAFLALPTLLSAAAAGAEVGPYEQVLNETMLNKLQSVSDWNAASDDIKAL